MLKLLFSFATVCAMLLVLMFAVGRALALPDVHFSYKDNTCVKVINYTDENFSCENMPSKFNHVWVE